MIVLDIETSGLHPSEHGIWQIGAIDFSNPEDTFLEEACIDKEDRVEEPALKIRMSNNKLSFFLRSTSMIT